MTTLAVLGAAQASGGNAWGHGGGWWFPIAIVFWIAVVAAVVFFISRGGRSRHRGPVNRARDILSERFARGEMSPDEYEERLSHL
ncbi:MAG: SHOCT domain-containing protein [Chloroflexota bacterium]